MATVLYGNGGIKYDYASVQSGMFTKVTSSQVVITTTEGWAITGYGNFNLSNGSITGGTITAYSVNRPDGQLYVSVSGLSLSVSTYNNYANRGDGLGLFKHILSGNDSTSGGTGNDTFLSTSGYDFYYGGGGTDIVYYATTRASHTITKNTTNNTMTVSKPFTSAVDSLDKTVERIHFADNKAVAFDVDGTAGQVYRMYQAAFDRKPDVGGLGLWIATMESGMSLADVAAGFANSQEFKNLYGASPTTAELVTRLYQNVLHRAPDSGGFQHWTGLLDSGQLAVKDVMVGFSESLENKAAVMGSISGGMEYNLWLG
ncbi:MAG TPA: DUF4214 domain-containing protein [Noviherbaspirillum sp.]|nr:DUF4214 domain-containing protein [Noviherbaspirillum sp.]